MHMSQFSLSSVNSSLVNTCIICFILQVPLQPITTWTILCSVLRYWSSVTFLSVPLMIPVVQDTKINIKLSQGFDQFLRKLIYKIITACSKIPNHLSASQVDRYQDAVKHYCRKAVSICFCHLFPQNRHRKYINIKSTPTVYTLLTILFLPNNKLVSLLDFLWS